MSTQGWLDRLFARGRDETIASRARGAQKRAYLHAMDIFRDLSPESMGELDHRTRMTTAPRGRVIYTQDERPQALFLIKSGRVQLYRLSPEGKKLVVGILEPGTFFGEMPIIGETMQHTFAEIVDESLLCVMTRSDLERIVLDNPRVGLRMIEVMARRLAESEALREEMAFRSTHARIAASLLRLSEQRHQDDTVHVTHQDLSDMVGAYRETVTVALNDLQSDGLVDLGRGRVVIRDRAGLRSRAQD